MNLMKFWPLAAGAVAVVVIWAANAFKIEQILETEETRLEQIRELQSGRIDQLLFNKKVETEHESLKQQIELISRRCK